MTRERLYSPTAEYFSFSPSGVYSITAAAAGSFDVTRLFAIISLRPLVVFSTQFSAMTAAGLILSKGNLTSSFRYGVGFSSMIGSNPLSMMFNSCFSRNEAARQGWKRNSSFGQLMIGLSISVMLQTSRSHSFVSSLNGFRLPSLSFTSG